MILNKKETIILEIEKGIEKPAAQKRAGIKYPWVTMEVGDSFFIPGGKLRSIKSLVYGRNRKRDGGKFSAFSVDGGVRVWRDA